MNVKMIRFVSVCFLVPFMGAPMLAQNPLGSLDLSKTADKLLEKAFTAENFKTPTVTFTEDTTHITLVISGANVTGSHNIDREVHSKFWQGNLHINETDGLTSSDVVTVSFHIHHKYDPHRPPDQFEGNEAILQMTVDSANPGTPSGANFERTEKAEKWALHQDSHSDLYKAQLTTTNAKNIGPNRVLAWKLELQGVHLTSLPMSLGMLAPSAPPGGVARLAIAANENVTALQDLQFVLQFDPTLLLTEADVMPGALFANSEQAVDLRTRGQVSLHFRAPAAVNGPGTVVTLSFHLPQKPTSTSYSIVCNDIQALDVKGQTLEVGCNDGAINVAQ